MNPRIISDPSNTNTNLICILISELSINYSMKSKGLINKSVKGILSLKYRNVFGTMKCTYVVVHQKLRFLFEVVEPTIKSPNTGSHYIKSQYIRDQFVNPSTTASSIRLSRRSGFITPHFGALALKYDVKTSLRSNFSAYYALVLALDQSDAAVQANHSADSTVNRTPRGVPILTKNSGKSLKVSETFKEV